MRLAALAGAGLAPAAEAGTPHQHRHRKGITAVLDRMAGILQPVTLAAVEAALGPLVALGA